MCGNVDLLSLNLRVYLLRYGVEQLVERPLYWSWWMTGVCVVSRGFMLLSIQYQSIVVPMNSIHKLIGTEEDPKFSFSQLSRLVSTSTRPSFSFGSHVDCLMVYMTSSARSSWLQWWGQSWFSLKRSQLRQFCVNSCISPLNAADFNGFIALLRIRRGWRCEMRFQSILYASTACLCTVSDTALQS